MFSDDKRDKLDPEIRPLFSEKWIVDGWQATNWTLMLTKIFIICWTFMLTFMLDIFTHLFPLFFGCSGKHHFSSGPRIADARGRSSHRGQGEAAAIEMDPQEWINGMYIMYIILYIYTHGLSCVTLYIHSFNHNYVYIFI